MENQKVSIIVPLYNTEKYIKRCLESIQNQTYQNLEVIVVNDGSTDDSESLAKEIAVSDDRITVVNHSHNKGLYHARITGVEASTGDFIAFVDSDDYISCDYIRTLVYKAEETSSDVVVGKTVHEDEKGYRYVHNLYHFYDFGIMNDNEILEKYWDQEGRCFIWHTIWNKLYAREIWDKALPILKKQEKHLIMTEDFVFSSVLLNFAHRLTSVEYGAYFYFQHGDASTSTKGGLKKFEKNIGDLKTAFDFVYSVITNESYRVDAVAKFKKWSDLYLYFWRENVENSALSDADKKAALELLQDSLKDNGTKITDPSYFYSVSTEYDNRYDSIVEMVANADNRVISFDIFDTAVLRPFYRPTDLFRVLNDEFRNLYPNESRTFQTIRIRAEKAIRDKKIYASSATEDEITFKDIYDEIENISSVPQSILHQMAEKEMAAEIRYTTVRGSVLNLFRVARHCGKKVCFTTDMYLPRETIEEILNKCGYQEYNDLIVSSEENATKRSGKLFEVLIKKTGASKEQIVHIGDNWDTDVEKARETGIKTVFYPSTLNCIQYNIADIKTTHSCCPYSEPSGSMINFEKAKEHFGTRSALAVAANMLYDNPFMSYNQWTEVNCSPVFLGYYALGMHLLGFTKWVTEKAIASEYDTLMFVARDGYLPMQAYNIIKSCYPFSPEAKYFYTSRKAGFAATVKCADDLYCLYDYINHNSCTIHKYLTMISPLLDNLDEFALRQKGFDVRKPFKDYSEYCRLVKVISQSGFKQSKCDSYQEKLAEYFNEFIFGKTACVDIGYSGRTQEVLKRVTGKSVDAFYVHTNDDQCTECERKNQFSVYSYYDFTPSITGGSREVLFSEYTPSCIGYDLEDEIKPVFEEMEENYPAKYLISEIQRNALLFINDFTNIFGEALSVMDMRSSDVSYPYEYFLHTLTDADSKMFDCFAFEDDMWAGKTMRLSDYWKECIRYHKVVPFYMQGKERVEYIEKFVDKPYVQGELEYQVYIKNGLDKKSKLTKALYWYLVDKNFFKQRLKDQGKN